MAKLPTVKTNLQEFLATKPSNQAEIQTIEFKHPGFSKVYYITYQSLYGRQPIVAKLETGEEVTFEYFPAQVERKSEFLNLDQSFRISIDASAGLLDELRLAKQYNIDNGITQSDDGFFPQVIYRSYNHQYLDEPLEGPIDLEIKTASFSDVRNGQVFSATAEAPTVNNNRTGDTYNLVDVPMLEGFLYG